VRDLRLEGVVKIIGQVPRSEAVEAQQASDILLLIESESVEAKGVLTGKLFEYIASGRPILSIGSACDSAIAKMLKRTGTGICLGSNVDAIKEYLSNALYNGSMFYAPVESEIDKLSRVAQANALFSLIQDNLHNRRERLHTGWQTCVQNEDVP